MLCVIMLSVVMLNVVMLSIMAPLEVACNRAIETYHYKVVWAAELTMSVLGLSEMLKTRSLYVKQH
jgi:hypothetical protein